MLESLLFLAHGVVVAMLCAWVMQGDKARKDSFLSLIFDESSPGTVQENAAKGRYSRGSR